MTITTVGYGDHFPVEKQLDPAAEIGELKTELAAMHAGLTAIRGLLSADRRGD